MNLLLFDAPFESVTLSAASVQATHIRKVLRGQVGTKVFVGFVNGLRARAEVVSLSEAGDVGLQIIGSEAAPKPLPISLLVGLPRPHTAKRLLFDAASMGVQALHFFESERGEPSYAQSSLWSTDEWRDRLRLGVEQSFGTHMPEVAMHADLQSAISSLYGAEVTIALDNYEADGALAAVLPSSAKSVLIALGSERGWSPGERDIFRKNGWKLAHLGAHVLRAETAAVAAISAVSAKLDLWQTQTTTVL